MILADKIIRQRKKLGWSDTQVVIRFVIIQLVIGYGAIYLVGMISG